MMKGWAQNFHSGIPNLALISVYGFRYRDTVSSVSDCLAIAKNRVSVTILLLASKKDYNFVPLSALIQPLLRSAKSLEKPKKAINDVSLTEK
jgi:hypothetical protein